MTGAEFRRGSRSLHAWLNTPDDPLADDSNPVADGTANKLVEIAAVMGNEAAVAIVAEYASCLTNEGRDALIRAIGEAYYPTRFEGYKSE